MRNYRRYWVVKSRLQFESPPGSGNWVDSSLQWQVGRTESEMEDVLANDIANLGTGFRYNPIERQGVVYWLLDSDFLIQLAFRDLFFGGLSAAHWQFPPSPRKSWSNGH